MLRVRAAVAWKHVDFPGPVDDLPEGVLVAYGAHTMNLHATADTLAASFTGYPLMTALAGPPEQQRRVLPFFFRCCTRHARARGGVLADEGGAALWLDSQLGPTTLEALRCGLFALPLRVGLDRVRRAARHEARALELVDDAVQGRYGCLWFVGVRTEQHGRGTARRLVEAALREMAARGLPQCVLTTEVERNVTIWSRCGFQVRAQAHVAATDLPVWVMTRATAGA